MNGAPIYTTSLEVPEVAVEANDNEDIIEGDKVSKINESSNETEIYLEEEQKIEKYKVTLKIDIENIVKIENIHNHQKRYWRKIYEVIQQEFFDESKIFRDLF